MVKSKDLVLLRQYIYFGDEVAFEELKALFTEGIKEAYEKYKGSYFKVSEGSSSLSIEIPRTFDKP